MYIETSSKISSKMSTRIKEIAILKSADTETLLKPISKVVIFVNISQTISPNR